MTIVLLNLSGNVGKSTLAKHLLKPRIPSARIYPVETINTDAFEEATIRAESFRQILEAVAINEDAIVDVGASNAEEFIRQMAKYKGSHDDFGTFLVPTVPDPKALRDTAATIAQLASIGVPPDRIHCVVNRVTNEAMLLEDIDGLMNFAQQRKQFTLNPEIYIRENELFSYLQTAPETVAELAGNTTDVRAQIRAAETDDEKRELVSQLANTRLAAGVQDELDQVYNALFAGRS